MVSNLLKPKNSLDPGNELIRTSSIPLTIPGMLADALIRSQAKGVFLVDPHPWELRIGRAEIEANTITWDSVNLHIDAASDAFTQLANDARRAALAMGDLQLVLK